jgi:hypothetical protein
MSGPTLIDYVLNSPFLEGKCEKERIFELLTLVGRLTDEITRLCEKNPQLKINDKTSSPTKNRRE